MRKCTIVIPIYRRLKKSECSTLWHNITVLHSWPVNLVGPKGNLELLEKIRAYIPSEMRLKVSIEFFDDCCFNDTSGYNKLLLSRFFYRRFVNSKYILICQTDALVLRDSLAEWLEKEFAFVGAPHFNGFDQPLEPLTFRKSQNGGFSLRRVSDVLSVTIVHESPLTQFLIRNGLLEKINSLLSMVGRSIIQFPGEINEDLFWSEVVPSVAKYYRVPTAEVAARFAFEVRPEHLFKVSCGQLPFGCHAFMKYQPDFWQNNLSKNLAFLVNEAVQER
jgi:hypothetical protein